MISKERKNEIQKQYYQRHADYYREYRRKYWKKNRDAILQMEKEKVVAAGGRNYKPRNTLSFET